MRLRALVSRRRVESELDEELSFHLAMEAEKNRARGVDPREAGRMARREFGGVEHFREECRDARGLSADRESGARCAIRSARAATDAGVHGGCDGVSGDRDWGEHGGVQPGGHGAAAHAAGAQHAEELVVLGWSANNCPRINTDVLGFERWRGYRAVAHECVLLADVRIGAAQRRTGGNDRILAASPA